MVQHASAFLDIPGRPAELWGPASGLRTHHEAVFGGRLVVWDRLPFGIFFHRDRAGFGGRREIVSRARAIVDVGRDSYAFRPLAMEARGYGLWSRVSRTHMGWYQWWGLGEGRELRVTYGLDLGLLLLGAGIGIEVEGGHSCILALLDNLLLGVVGSNRALGVARSFYSALLLELIC